MLRLMWSIFIWLCLKIGDPLRHLHTQFRGHISRGKGSTEGPVCWDVFLPMDADSMLKLQTLNSQYVMTYQIIDIPLLKKGEVSTRCWFYSLNASIQKSFIHPSWCLIAAIRWPLSWQSVLSDDQHVESLVGDEASNRCKLLMITKDTCGSCSGFYSCWLWTRQNRQNLATLGSAPVSTTILVTKSIKTKVDLTTKNMTNFAVRWNLQVPLGMNFSLNFPLLNCQGIVKKIVAEPRPGSTTLRPFWTPIVMNGVKWVAPMNGRKLMGSWGEQNRYKHFVGIHVPSVLMGILTN